MLLGLRLGQQLGQPLGRSAVRPMYPATLAQRPVAAPIDCTQSPAELDHPNTIPAELDHPNTISSSARPSEYNLQVSSTIGCTVGAFAVCLSEAAVQACSPVITPSSAFRGPPSRPSTAPHLLSPHVHVHVHVARGCNPMRQRLQPYAPEAATLCARRSTAPSATRRVVGARAPCVLLARPTCADSARCTF